MSEKFKESVKDNIARAAGTTVSVATNLSRKIKEEVKLRVEETGHKMNFVPREDFERLQKIVDSLQTRVADLEKGNSKKSTSTKTMKANTMLRKAKPKSTAKAKPAAKPKPKTTPKKAAAAAKPAAKKAAAKKPAAKKAPAKKPVAKKPAAKKPAVKKAVAKKPVAKKAPAKKPAAKKPAAKKPAAKKAPAKK